MLADGARCGRFAVDPADGVRRRAWVLGGQGVELMAVARFFRGMDAIIAGPPASTRLRRLGRPRRSRICVRHQDQPFAGGRPTEK